MTKAVSASLLPPAVRSCLDVALWFLGRASAEQSKLPLGKLQHLLYLAQAAYASQQKGWKLMPATFLAGRDGPYEPTLQLALESGLANPPAPSVPPAAELVLRQLWQQYGPMPAPVMARLLAADEAWRGTMERNPNGEITVDAMLRAGGERGQSRATAVRRSSPATGDAPAAVRFTLDGREVKAWAPRRRIDAGTA